MSKGYDDIEYIYINSIVKRGAGACRVSDFFIALPMQRLYGISRFFQPGGRLEPVNKELMIDSIESFYGTLELTPGWLPWHSVFGMVVYIVVVGNAALGFLQMLTILENSAGVPKYGSEAYLVNFAAISTILFGVFVIFTLLGDPLILIVQTSTELSHT